MPGLDHKNATIKPFSVETAITRYRAVKNGTVTGAVIPVTAATDLVVGFAIEDGIAGENRGIAMEGGHIYGEAGAAITAQADLMIDAVGRVIAWTAAAGTNVALVGRALEAAGAAGDVIPMLYIRGSKQG